MQRVSSQNAPVTTAGSVISNGPTIIVPITVKNFSNIGGCKLTLNYNSTILSATSVSMGSLFPFSSLSSNVATPGTVIISWISTNGGQTQPDNSVLFNITFTRIQVGTSTLTWFDNGNSCKWSNGSNVTLNDTPTATYYINGSVSDQNAPKTIASVASACPGSIVSIPVIVNEFNSIGSVSLMLKYTATVLTYQSSSINPAYPGLAINGTIPGTVVIAGSSASGVSLPSNSTLLTLNFTYNGGSTGLNWFDDGESCEYADLALNALNDSPQTTYYFNGSVNPGATQWTGLVSSSWETLGNWSCDFPAANADVTINSAPHYPVISSAVTIKNLTINTGSVTINPNATLTVSNTLANNVAGNTGLLIKSDATGTGSLLHYSENVSATIQRYTTGSTDLNIFKYHFVSVPLKQSENPTSNLFYGSYLFEFTEGTNQWLALGAPTATNLASNKGYMIYYPEAEKTYAFAGKMNNGAFSVPVTYSGTGTHSNTAGFNLVPNPYPSAIDWLASSGWSKFGIDNAVYIWPSTAGAGATVLNYTSFVDGVSLHNGSRYIAQGQSFFVHAFENPAGFAMTNDVRVHNPVTFFKEGEIIPDLLRITAVANNANDEMVVRFKGDATPAFDGSFDAFKLAGGADAPQLNSVTSDNSKLSINSLPFNENETVVPLNFSFSSATNVTFTASGMETFYGTQPMYLEDKLLDKMINLRENPVYTFSYEPGSDENRFKLHFASVLGKDEPQKPTTGTAYLSEGRLYVEVPSMKGQKTEVGIFNALGQQLNLKRVAMNGMIDVPFALPAGVYIVRVTSSTQVYVTKLVNQ